MFCSGCSHMLSECVVHSLRTKQLVIVILQNQCLGVAPTTKQRYNYFCSDVLFAKNFFVILHKITPIALIKQGDLPI